VTYAVGGCFFGAYLVNVTSASSAIIQGYGEDQAGQQCYAKNLDPTNSFVVNDGACMTPPPSGISLSAGYFSPLSTGSVRVQFGSSLDPSWTQPDPVCVSPGWQWPSSNGNGGGSGGSGGTAGGASGNGGGTGANSFASSSSSTGTHTSSVCAFAPLRVHTSQRLTCIFHLSQAERVWEWRAVDRHDAIGNRARTMPFVNARSVNGCAL
jgi:hypothetical protein